MIRLLMTTDAVGGVWRYALDAGIALAARDVAVSLVGLGPRPSVARIAEAEAAGIALHWLDCPLDWMAGGRDELAGSGEALDAHVRRLDPDLVQVNAPALLPWLGRNRPRIAAVHSCLATWWQAVKRSPLPEEWLWHRQATAEGLAAADAVIAPSRSFAAALEDAYGPLPHLQVVHNGIHPIQAAPKQRYVLAAGRWWDEGKNLSLLDAAAARAAWTVFVAGPLRGDSSWTETPQTAVWLGELPHAEMRHRLAEAAIFVSPSVYEPFGLAVLEAASAGAALVLADIPTFRELWDGAALFADPRDAAAMAFAINRLALDDELRETFADAARRRAQSYSAEAHARALADVYSRFSTDRRLAG